MDASNSRVVGDRRDACINRTASNSRDSGNSILKEVSKAGIYEKKAYQQQQERQPTQER